MVAAVPIGIRRSTGPGWALRRDFARLLVLAVVLPALALVIFLSWSEANADRAMASDRLRTLAQWTARDIDDFVDVHRAAVQVLAERRTQERTVPDAARWQADFRRMRAAAWSPAIRRRRARAFSTSAIGPIFPACAAVANPLSPVYSAAGC
jgi:hypothetical protein